MVISWNNKKQRKKVSENRSEILFMFLGVDFNTPAYLVYGPVWGGEKEEEKERTN